ncbi:hypothetical protein GOP47_0007046 [Adiantum capillus-veneris]|uniref:S1 motif domain-containing protein n=1 Tax=Adiantum capillus-veneris TaxID=13818 RepID=A0A9D4V0S2_ADICA|nr:hypothetical protein GOP47_0007046 [Adiantum capillus-veneris]
MATSSTVGRLPYVCEEESCRGCLHQTKPGCNLTPSSLSSPQLSRGLSIRPSGYGKLAYVGIKVSNVEFMPDILDIRYRENNRAAPPVVPCYPPLEENGPNELDFEIYASNSMANYEPPPPPRVPFGIPFEDYYGEAIGVDYITKEEKPANSLLQLLDSLNAKKVKEGGENTKKRSYPSGSLLMAETAEEKPQQPESAGQGSGEDINDVPDLQEIINDSEPINVSGLVKTNADENVPFSSNKGIRKLTEQPSNSSQFTRHEKASAHGRNLRAQNSLHLLSPTIVSRNESQDIGGSSSVHSVPQEQHAESRSLEDLKRRTQTFLTNGAVEEAPVKDNFQSGMHSKRRTSAAVDIAPGSPDDIAVPHTAAQHQIKGNLRQTGYNYTPSEAILQENAKLSKMRVVAPVDPGREYLTSAQTLDSFKETFPTSQFYVPREGDLVVGAVTFINDQKVDLEIGAKLSALMPLRELQPLVQHAGNGFFDTSGKDSLRMPFGESLLVRGELASNSFSHTGIVGIGSILVAEVIAKTIIDGRAILSCKSPAQKLAWHRIDQLMRLGEAVQIKIMQWNEGGLLGSFESIRAFIPKSELVQKPESIALLKNYVGRTLSVAIVQTNRQTFNIIASEVQAWMSKNLQLGTVHDVTVTRVHTYGMQVEIDNTKIRGFVHKMNFSKEFVNSATNYFAEGDKARVMLIKGSDPTKISFSLADLEKENGLLLRDKEQVFHDAEEMGRRFRERLSEQEKRIYGVTGSVIGLRYQDPEIANLGWLRIGNALS